jgi:hypothetical protein
VREGDERDVMLAAAGRDLLDDGDVAEELAWQSTGFS